MMQQLSEYKFYLFHEASSKCCNNYCCIATETGSSETMLITIWSQCLSMLGIKRILVFALCIIQENYSTDGLCLRHSQDEISSSLSFPVEIFQ